MSGKVTRFVEEWLFRVTIVDGADGRYVSEVSGVAVDEVEDVKRTLVVTLDGVDGEYQQLVDLAVLAVGSVVRGLGVGCGLQFTGRVGREVGEVRSGKDVLLFSVFPCFVGGERERVWLM